MSEPFEPTSKTGNPPLGGAAADDGATGPHQAWFARYGLIRPRHDKYIAGVCAAIGRATGTDPLLWRVLIGVLALFGVGLLIYLVLWLLTPAEGDDVSPVEALLGRGHSSTPTALTIILGVAVVLLVGAITNNFYFALVALVGLSIAAMVTNRGQPSGRWAAAGSQASPSPGMPGGPTTPPPPTAGSGPDIAAIAPQPQEGMMTAPNEPGGAAPQHQSTPPGRAGYRPPFAPHGPYQTLPPPPPRPPRPPVAPRPAREPSRLGRLTFSVGLLALGTLGVIDLLGASVPGIAYLATALAVTGLGLLLGTWFGRARGLIAVGIMLSVLIFGGLAHDNIGEIKSRGGGQIFYEPTRIEELSSAYRHQFGEATLDLRGLELAGQNKTIDVSISFGRFRVLLPEGVDTTIVSSVNFGDVDALGRVFGGVGVDDTMKIEGQGDAGHLLINLKVNFGHAEVTR